MVVLTRPSDGRGDAAAERIAAVGPRLWAPHMIDAEVGHVLRRHVHRERLSADVALDALLDFNDLRLERVPHTALLRRAWALRDSLSFYDGLYVALAEELDRPLFTLDARMARAHGHRARIEVLG